MPGYLSHCHLASLIISDTDYSDLIGISINNTTLQRNFILGAIAPDAGYLPGAPSFYSDLVHYISTGTLARNLIRHAESEDHLAFAYGWCTHILGDIVFHPYINRATAYSLKQEFDPPLSYWDAPAEHVRIELGLDLLHVEQQSRLFQRDFFTATNADSLCAYLATAFHDTYHVSSLRKTICNAIDTQITLLPYIGSWYHAIGTPPTGSRPGFHTYNVMNRLAARLFRWIPSSSKLNAIANPTSPAEFWKQWQPEAADRFTNLYKQQARLGFQTLGEFNLDTGLLETDTRYLPAEKAKRQLAKLKRKKTNRGSYAE